MSLKQILLILIPVTAFGQIDSLMPDTLTSDIIADTVVNELRGESAIAEIDSISVPQTTYKVANDIDSSSVPPKYSVSGSLIGIGVGLSLGNLPVLDLWKNSLPDSLGSFGLQATSFRIEPDTSLPDSLQQADTAQMKYQIKEKPNVYNMIFPFKLSFLKIRENDRFSTSVFFSLISKKFKASVFAVDDSLDRRVDIREKMLLYSLAVEALYGYKIPERYFSIDGAQRSDFVAGVGIAPLVSLRTINTTDLYSSDPRMSSVNGSILSSQKKLTSYGLSVSLRAGISSIHSLESKGALEIGVFYSLNWYNYFFSNSQRIHTTDIDPFSNNKELSFLSNRFEISVTLLRGVK